MYFLFYQRGQILTFDTKSSHIARTFLWPFLQTFGHAYSPLNSAMLSCSSEVTLTQIEVHTKFVTRDRTWYNKYRSGSVVSSFDVYLGLPPHLSAYVLNIFNLNLPTRLCFTHSLLYYFYPVKCKSQKIINRYVLCSSHYLINKLDYRKVASINARY